MQGKIKRISGGECMTEQDNSLEQFLHDLLEKEQERHEQFMKEHEELMQMIDEARKGMHKHD